MNANFFRNPFYKKLLLLSIWSPVVGSHFGRTCLILARIRPGVPRHWLFPSVSGGLPPRLLPPSGGLGSSPGVVFIFGWNATLISISSLFQDHTFTFKYWSPVVGSHFGRTCLILARIRPGVPRYWLFPSVSGGLPPRLLPPSGGLGSSPGAWGAPNKGNADGAVGIFGKCRTRVGYGPATGPILKRSCAILAR